MQLINEESPKLRYKKYKLATLKLQELRLAGIHLTDDEIPMLPDMKSWS